MIGDICGSSSSVSCCALSDDFVVGYFDGFLEMFSGI